MSLYFNFSLRTQIFQTPAITKVRSGMNYNEPSWILSSLIIYSNQKNINFDWKWPCNIRSCCLYQLFPYCRFHLPCDANFTILKQKPKCNASNQHFDFLFFFRSKIRWSWKQESDKRLSNRRIIFFFSWTEICLKSYLCRPLAPTNVIILLWHIALTHNACQKCRNSNQILLFSIQPHGQNVSESEKRWNINKSSKRQSVKCIVAESPNEFLFLSFSLLAFIFVV